MKLAIPKKNPIDGDKYVREDGAVFIFDSKSELGWVKQ